ncbi:bifunctional hydroxymethylpyrimidine kinase/phosphomethylpyrimidine kinase [Mucilaginibacter sp. Bleaf8]|uniref:bifunctional hydroxymethylpyrimidine kinase/phosphomethylpyrimidine kinase n=1 Tax=Mucilaginibacter sp. Bleaf8 TaxID=2834430 RepID=UPI001BD019D7|nr:bifunctional hydroxymethylpyrimidine kinase/phosphomethylpyrimidine kinase [Mucilaginibacter sp. Bleaf8]MBS7562936.1 bifunctional hydroxymethylpyrimidine kinase/phosphomethylpyrimidine kinase [Mucilaginibacter sp. Bleaf8]
MTSLLHQYLPVLTIAGSDSGGGAGIQADMKTFAALGCYGTSAITAITVQNTLGVSAIHPVPAEIVAGQIAAVINDIKPKAIKIGMLPNAETIRAVARLLKSYPGTPVILDPVSVASSGYKLMNEEAVGILQQELFPLATLLTPNLPEAAMLTGLPVANLADMYSAASRILKSGCKAVLLKGGHLTGNKLYNVYVDESGYRQQFESDYIASVSTHGTGCTLSSAITAYLARGLGLIQAIEQAGTYVNNAIAHGKAVKTGEGNGPLNHFFAPEPAIKVNLS